MIQIDLHFPYIIASYSVVFLGMAVLVLHTVFTARKLDKQLKKAEQHGAVSQKI